MKRKCWELFECQRCGRCCIEYGLPPPNIYLDGERISIIARHLDLTDDQIIEKYYGRIKGDGIYEIEEHKRKPCPFLKSETDNQKTCTIYEVRPRGCRDFPYDTEGVGHICPAAQKAREKF